MFSTVERIKKKITKASFFLPGGNQRMVNYLRRIGIEIGEDLLLYDAPSIVIDETRPYLIKIGNHVRITHGAVILSHDFSKTVLNQKYGENIGDGALTVIGDNCFIGNNSIILMGTTIGNNVIVGAGSVVHGHIPDDVVIAGNPARIISSLDEHLKRRRIKSFIEAKNVALRYYERYGVMPSEHEMRFFRSCFNGKNEMPLDENMKKWDSFDHFIKDVEALISNERELNNVE